MNTVDNEDQGVKILNFLRQCVACAKLTSEGESILHYIHMSGIADYIERLENEKHKGDDTTTLLYRQNLELMAENTQLKERLEKAELSVVVPEQHYIMPLQPTKGMVDAGVNELEETAWDEDEDRVVFIYQSMLQSFSQSKIGGSSDE